MSEQLPEAVLGPGSAGGPAIGPVIRAAHAEPAWTSMREIGFWGMFRLLPGVVRSAFSGSEASPGGVPYRRERDAGQTVDHLADVSLDSAVIEPSSSPTAGPRQVADMTAELADDLADEMVDEAAASESLADDQETVREYPDEALTLLDLVEADALLTQLAAEAVETADVAEAGEVAEVSDVAEASADADVDEAGLS